MDGKVGESVGQGREEQHIHVKHASTYAHSLLCRPPAAPVLPVNWSVLLLSRFSSTGRCLGPCFNNTNTQSHLILPTHPPSLQILAFDFDTLKLRLGGWTPSFGLKAKIEPRWAACLPACWLAG